MCLSSRAQRGIPWPLRPLGMTGTLRTVFCLPSPIFSPLTPYPSLLTPPQGPVVSTPHRDSSLHDALHEGVLIVRSVGLYSP